MEVEQGEDISLPVPPAQVSTSPYKEQVNRDQKRKEKRISYFQYLGQGGEQARQASGHML